MTVSRDVDQGMCERGAQMVGTGGLVDLIDAVSDLPPVGTFSLFNEGL